MVINIQSTGVEMTDAIKNYAQEKMEAVEKYFDNIQNIDIDVGMKSHHHLKGKVFYAECNVSVPGKLIRVSKNAEDLYKAIDKVKDHLKVEFEKMKGKMNSIDKQALRDQKGYVNEEEE
ncbi:ribosome-associated translation inhibitor RaiA [Patescibacteria group bacterium]|nr:ribosome-associated translation inhibitor RaiA [Patescibacteria group bacterium]MBU1895383.1 ribosome-associated translation inhibitor RaiA [Patescibacteria group bacterium]